MAWNTATDFNVLLSNGDRTLVEDPLGSNPHTAKAATLRAEGAGLHVFQVVIDSALNYVEIQCADAINNMSFSWATFASPFEADSGLYSFPNVGTYLGAGYQLADADVLTFALNSTAKKLWIRRNADAWIGGGDPEAGTSPTFDISTIPSIDQYWPIGPGYYSADDGVTVQGATLRVAGADMDANAAIGGGWLAWDGSALPGGDPVTLDLPIAQTVYQYSESTFIPLRQTVRAPASLDLPVVQQVYAPGSVATANAQRYRPIVTVGGAGKAVISTVRIEQESRSSRIAEFSIAAAGVDPRTMVDQPVTIDYAVLNADGSIAFSIRRFTGWVIRPQYDPMAGTLRLYCSNKMQQRIDRMTRAQIDAITPGARWSEKVFGEDREGFDYFNDRLSTLPGDVDCDSYNRFVYKAWAKKPSADATYGGAVVLDAQLFTEDRSTIVNRIRLRHEVRRERSIIRRLNVGWHYPRTFCQYSAQSSTLPTRDMIASVLEGTGWLVSSVHYVPLWETAIYTCGVDSVNFVNYFPNLCIGFSANIQRRWTQTITETFNIVIESAAALSNPVEEDQTFGVSYDFDVDAFEGVNGDNRTAPLSTFGGGLSLPDGSGLGAERFPIPAGYTLSARGDYYFDNIDRDDWADALECKIEQLRCRILSGARRGGVEFKIPLDPRVDTSQTLAITAPLTATGKVDHWIEEIDAIGTGGPISTIRIALSDGDAATMVETPRLAPAPIAYDPEPTDAPGGLGSAWDNTHLGGLVASDPQDPDWSGYVGNYQPIEAGGIVYEEQFRIDITAIESDLRDNVELSAGAVYRVAVPNDPITL